MRRVAITLVFVALLLVAAPAAGFAAVASGDVLAQEEETTVPPSTSAPDTTEPEDGENNEAAWWVLLIVGGGLIILVVAVARGGRKKAVYVAPADPGWKPKARQGYADARWLYDTMTESLAIWRGNAQFDGTTERGTTAETAQVDAWDALASKMDAARDALYGLEAAAPDRRTAETAGAVVAALTATRRALDTRAEARYHYRAGQAGGDDTGGSSTSLAEARDRELRTAQRLSESRQTLGEVLTTLSTLT